MRRKRPQGWAEAHPDLLSLQEADFLETSRKTAEQEAAWLAASAGTSLFYGLPARP